MGLQWDSNEVFSWDDGMFSFQWRSNFGFWVLLIWIQVTPGIPFLGKLINKWQYTPGEPHKWEQSLTNLYKRATHRTTGWIFQVIILGWFLKQGLRCVSLPFPTPRIKLTSRAILGLSSHLEHQLIIPSNDT
jgi:hypothetical protein